MSFDPQIIVQYAVRVVGVLIVFAVGFYLSGFAGRLVERSLERAKVEPTLSRFARGAVRWTLLILVGIACLGAFGIETTSFAAVLGAAGLAIGLAFQGTLSSIAGGVMLLVMRPFKVGDVIEVAGRTGKVDEVGLFATTLDTPQNVRVILPNNAVFGAAIVNYTFHERRRVDVNVGVEYGASMERTRDVLLSAAKDIEGQVDEAVAVLISLGDSALNWQLRLWCHPSNYTAVLEAGTEATKDALDAAGLGIPFPQLDVHVQPQANQAAT